MLALVKTAPGPGLTLETVPDPEYGINDVLIRVHKTGSAAPTCTSTRGTRGPRRRSTRR